MILNYKILNSIYLFLKLKFTTLKMKFISLKQTWKRCSGDCMHHIYIYIYSHSNRNRYFSIGEIRQHLPKKCYKFFLDFSVSKKCECRIFSEEFMSSTFIVLLSFYRHSIYNHINFVSSKHFREISKRIIIVVITHKEIIEQFTAKSNVIRLNLQYLFYFYHKTKLPLQLQLIRLCSI